MRQRVWFGILTLAALALAGCGRSTAPLQSSSGGGAPAGSDEAQVAGVVDNNPQYVDEDLWQSTEAQPLDDPRGLAAIRPLRFWRTITSVERSRDITFGPPDPSGRPTEALVTIHKRLLGSFNILAGSTDLADTTRSLVHKPLDDRWTRRLLLRRRAVEGDTVLTRWHLVGTSGVEVHTQGGSTALQSVRVQSAGLDTTITDPLELHRLRHVLLLHPDAPITLTATTGRASDVVLFYGRDMRRRFANNGDGTFTFPCGTFPGLRHFGVDAFSNGTLFDDEAPYDSNAWLFLFAVDPLRTPIDGH